MEQRLSQGQISDIFIELEKQAREANARGTIFDFLQVHNIPFDEIDECNYNKSSVRLLIAGQSDVKKEHIFGILKKLGIDKNRVDMILDYDELKRFKWNDIQYSSKYSDVVFGACPHSVIGKGDYSSVISRMESEEGWPNPIRASANEALKFSQNSLLNALLETEFYKKSLSDY